MEQNPLYLHSKKNSVLLLIGVGVSTFGDFIYLVAINILVLQLTGSPAAVAGLWIISPIASILTKFWSGSLVDRMNQRWLMINTDIFRGLLIIFIPFITSIWVIYIFLFFLSVAKAFFQPTSMAYMTALVPKEERKRFNSFRSLITSGAFLVGPAIAGVLLMVTTADIAIWINSISFFISAFVLFLLPNISRDVDSNYIKKLSFRVLLQDWQSIFKFSKSNSYILLIYLLTQFFGVIALAMDAQEVVFTQQVLGLSEADFGFLISITGIGSVVGALTVSVFAKKMSIRLLMGLGNMMVAVGYLIYAFSFSFTSVAVGFILLGYFNAFANTGFLTFYQNNVPLDIMGRFLSVFGTLQSMFQIIFIMLIGFTGEIIPLRYSIIAGSILILCSSLLLTMFVYLPSRKSYFQEETDS